MAPEGRSDTVTDRANEDVFTRVLAAKPVLVDIRPAREVVPGMTERTVLHAGPPLPRDHRVSGALRGTVVGAALYEGWADTPDQAERLQLDYRGAPSCIDIRRVVASGVTPITNTGIAHRDGATGQIGAGYVRAPRGAFEAALAGLGAETAPEREAN